MILFSLIFSITHKIKSKACILNLGLQFCLYQHRYYIPTRTYPAVSASGVFLILLPCLEWFFFFFIFTWQLKKHLSNFHLKKYLPIIFLSWTYLSLSSLYRLGTLQSVSPLYLLSFDCMLLKTVSRYLSRQILEEWVKYSRYHHQANEEMNDKWVLKKWMVKVWYSCGYVAEMRFIQYIGVTGVVMWNPASPRQRGRGRGDE